jgi:hypothetical protein
MVCDYRYEYTSKITCALFTVPCFMLTTETQLFSNRFCLDQVKTATLGTAHVLRKVLMQMYKRCNTGNSIICTMDNNYRIAATLYSLETWFVSGI